MKKPKLGKRALASLRTADTESTSSRSEPTTAEEFLEQGSIDEESGDRWLGSDLSKSLRFYQKAYTSYLKSIRLKSGPENLDSYYNSSRLLFQVYYQYLKTDGVNIYDLTNVEEALREDGSSVIQPIGNVVAAHENAINIAKNSLSSSIPLDLLFNTATAYTEVLEVEEDNTDSDFNQLLEVTLKAQTILSDLLDTQLSEFKRFLDELKEINTVDESFTAPVAGNAEEKQSQSEYTAEEIVQPNDIFETILASYKLSQSMLENVTDPQAQITHITDLVAPLLTKSDTVAQELINNFSDVSSVKNDMVANLSVEQINEYKIIKTYIIGLTSNDIDQLIALWGGDEDSQLPQTSERYMSAADNIQTFLDRLDINLSFVNFNSTTNEYKNLFWKSLSQITTNLKKAQDLLNIQLSEKRKLPSGVDLGLGSLISQISEIMIARSDIDLQRCQITGYDIAQKNSSVLLNNAKTLLKNAMTLANTPGGLRERISEKLQREKKKVDAVLRLCVLEGKTSTNELDSILGRNKWIHELPNLIKLGYFESFGISNIEQPTSF